MVHISQPIASMGLVYFLTFYHKGQPFMQVNYTVRPMDASWVRIRTLNVSSPNLRLTDLWRPSEVPSPRKGRVSVTSFATMVEKSATSKAGVYKGLT